MMPKTGRIGKSDLSIKEVIWDGEAGDELKVGNRLAALKRTTKTKITTAITLATITAINPYKM
jgi:hypothetical protein